jgi:energy-coupling factor transporter ATP-binding protein EcfA2
MVREHSFVMVVGRSGSGKSSLVNAGLMPALRRDRSQVWDILSLRPGPEPLRALAAVFNPKQENEGLVAYECRIDGEAEGFRTGGPDLLSHVINGALNTAEGKPDRLLLYVDQWEELYAQSPLASQQRKALKAAHGRRSISLSLYAGLVHLPRSIALLRRPACRSNAAIVIALGVSVRPKRGITPGVRCPTPTSSIDTAQPLDRSASSSWCIRAVREQALLVEEDPVLVPTD